MALIPAGLPTPYPYGRRSPHRGRCS
jgi:hypothetical protein